MKKIALIILVILTVSACTQIGGSRFKRSYLSVKDSQNQTVGTLFVWEADSSAAVLFKGGEACMQTALAVKTANMQAEAQLSDAILQLSQAASKIASEPMKANESEKALAEVSGSIKEAANMLTTTTERTSFLNLGMFYLCQISANKSISQDQTSILLKELIKNSSAMTK